MKYSELKKIIENAYIDLSKSNIGDTKIDPDTGVKSVLTAVDPETGKLTWDISYEVDPEQLYKKLDNLSDFLKSAPKNSEMGKIGDIIKKLKNQVHRLI